jgi:hypothetical protein
LYLTDRHCGGWYFDIRYFVHEAGLEDRGQYDLALPHGSDRGIPFPQFGLDRFLVSISVPCERDDQAARPPSSFFSPRAVIIKASWGKRPLKPLFGAVIINAKMSNVVSRLASNLTSYLQPSRSPLER